MNFHDSYIATMKLIATLAICGVIIFFLVWFCPRVARWHDKTACVEIRP